MLEINLKAKSTLLSYCHLAFGIKEVEKNHSERCLSRKKTRPPKPMKATPTSPERAHSKRATSKTDPTPAKGPLPSKKVVTPVVVVAQKATIVPEIPRKSEEQSLIDIGALFRPLTPNTTSMAATHPPATTTPPTVPAVVHVGDDATPPRDHTATERHGRPPHLRDPQEVSRGLGGEDPSPAKPTPWWINIIFPMIVLLLALATLFFRGDGKGVDLSGVHGQIETLRSQKNDLGDQITSLTGELEKLKEVPPPKVDVNTVLADPSLTAKIDEIVGAKVAEARAMIIADSASEAIYTLLGGGLKLRHGDDEVVLVVRTAEGEDGEQEVKLLLVPYTSGE